MHIPPLRERRQDIPDLCDYLLKKIALGRAYRLSDLEVKKLMQYDWPGNVRELKNILERSFILQRGDELRPSELLTKAHYAQSDNHEMTFNKVIKPLEEIEKQHIKYALEGFSGNLTKTAKALGISLSTLKRKVKDFNLT
jgi:transcriptional regulator with PAS, ATPase and Fis domain